jgi:hypothetical protein
MLKIWSYGYWNPDNAPTAMAAAKVKSSSKAGYFGIAMLVVFALFLGFGAEAVYKVANRAGDQLVDRKAYVTAVLGDESYAEIGRLLAERENGEPAGVGAEGLESARSVTAEAATAGGDAISGVVLDAEGPQS